MGHIGLRPFLAFLILALAGCSRDALEPVPSAVPAHVTDKPEGRPVDRGRAIYTRGKSPSGRPITARIGDGPAVPAAALACVQCHGVDGRGRPEGGVTPSDITWANLTRPYGVAHPDGRKHPAYTAALFGRAVTMGWDPAGQALSSVMPRYQMAPEDLADLVAYVRQIAADTPGVSAATIRIGVALPPVGPQQSHWIHVNIFITDYINSINATGGVFRRRMDLVAPTSGGGDREAFAAIGGLTPDGDPTSERLESAGVPMVRVYPPPVAGWLSRRNGSFALVSGHAGQVRALVRFAAENRVGFDAGIVVIHGTDPGSRCACGRGRGPAPRGGDQGRDDRSGPVGIHRCSGRVATIRGHPACGTGDRRTGRGVGTRPGRTRGRFVDPDS